jgi:hypothetical protein
VTFALTTDRSKILIEQRLGEHELEQLARHSRITSIGLFNLKLADLQFLSLLPRLERLEIYGGSIGSYEALSTIPTLRQVFLNRIRALDDLTFLAGIAELETVDLLYLSNVESIPDLSARTRLTTLRIIECKRLVDLTALAAIPSLESLEIVVSPLTPEDIEFLMAAENLPYINLFGGARQNARTDAMLERYGKARYRPDLAES